MKFIKYAFLIGITLLLTACVRSKVGDFEKNSIHITEIEIHLPEPDSNNELSKITNSFEQRFNNAMHNYAAAYNKTKTGRIEGYKMKVSVKNVHFKNPLLSLIVGDANGMSAKVEIIDPTNGQTLRSYEKGYADGGSALVNGIGGALLSVSVSKYTAETTLINGISKQLLNTAFLLKTTPRTISKLNKEHLLEPPIGPISPLSSQQPTSPDILAEDAAADQLLQATILPQ